MAAAATGDGEEEEDEGPSSATLRRVSPVPREARRSAGVRLGPTKTTTTTQPLPEITFEMSSVTRQLLPPPPPCGCWREQARAAACALDPYAPAGAAAGRWTRRDRWGTRGASVLREWRARGCKCTAPGGRPKNEREKKGSREAKREKEKKNEGRSFSFVHSFMHSCIHILLSLFFFFFFFQTYMKPGEAAAYANAVRVPQEHRPPRWPVGPSPWRESPARAAASWRRS